MSTTPHDFVTNSVGGTQCKNCGAWLSVPIWPPFCSQQHTTTPSAKDRVLAWVRSKNPQTMELKLGCKVNIAARDCSGHALNEIIREHRKSTCTVLAYDPGGRVGDDYDGDTLTVWCDEWGIARCWGEHAEDDEDCEIPEYEILGSDMGLSELHIAFPLLVGWTAGNNQFYIGWHEATGDPLSFEGDLGLESVPFDLTKNLHNQAPEFYTALLPLIPDA